MIFLQTGQEIDLLNRLVDICPPFVIIAGILLGIWIVYTQATKRR